MKKEGWAPEPVGRSAALSKVPEIDTVNVLLVNSTIVSVMAALAELAEAKKTLASASKNGRRDIRF